MLCTTIDTNLNTSVLYGCMHDDDLLRRMKDGGSNESHNQLRLNFDDRYEGYIGLHIGPGRNMSAIAEQVVSTP